MRKFSVVNAIACISFAALLFSSCEKKDDDPSYAGTWVANENMELIEPGVPIPVKMTLILSRSRFEWQVAASLSGTYINIGAVKGDLSATDTQMTISPTAVGMTNQNGSIEWVNKGEPGFEEELANWGMSETMTSAYTVVGNTLTMEIDNVPTVFTRQ